MISVRSLRFQLTSLCLLLTLAWMSAVGVFTFFYLRHALESSRATTMLRREERLVHYVNDAHAHVPGLTLEETLHFYHEASLTPDDLIQIFDRNGTLLYAVDKAAPRLAWPGSGCLEPCFGQVEVAGHSLRTIEREVVLGGKPMVLCMAGSMDEHYRLLDNVLRAYLLAAPLMLLASVGGAVFLIGRAMRAVDRITLDARQIGIHDLKRRLKVVETADELQRLTETWNELLGRLDIAVSRLRQFTSDLSHDLRTSTTVMLATAEIALRSERSAEEYQIALTTIAVECEATTQMLDDLLSIGNAGLDQEAPKLLPIGLHDLVEEVCEQMQGKFAQKQQTLTWELCETGWVRGDLPSLRRLTSILLDNASKYTPRGGSIRVTVRYSELATTLEVCDNGAGIAPEHIPHLFDRFYRADSARAREDGRGLGLSIAKTIALHHQAHISVSSTVGRGSVFRVEFPLSLRDGNVSRESEQELLSLLS